VTAQPGSILDLFRETGAYLNGHFRLTSGLHSPEYLQCALVLQHPAHAERLGAELADRLQYPIRTYSTGMLLRLAFAISTSIKPDILVMDEMIGAGDAHFLEKARMRVQSLIGASSILAISSHNLPMIREFCTSAILLNNGQLLAQGSVDEVIARYEQLDGESPV